MMTCCHYVIFWTYFDILIEFTSNMKYPGVLEARNHEEMKASKSWHDFFSRDMIFLAERHVFELIISWQNFLKRGTILRRIWNTTRVKCQIVTQFLQGMARFRLQKIFSI